MAKLTASNGFYGHSGNKNYTNSAANHLYAGKSASTSNYRSRMAFPSLRSHLGLDAGARIVITAMKLYLYRNDGGPTKVYAGCSTSSAWGAATAGYGSAQIPASTGWHSINLSASAEAVAGYTGSWYIHLTGEGSSRIRFDGTGSSHKPYLEITWEYVAATIKSDKETVQLGESVTFTITPEVEGETHTMTYAIGDAQGVIGENFGDSITFALNPALAAEIPDDDTGTLDIRMTAYDPSGSVLRTERYFQTVKVPATMAAKVGSVGAELLNGLGSYGLTGRSRAILAPVIDVNDSYGAAVKTVTATVTNGETVQMATWTEFEETEPGLFACAPVQTFVFGNAGDATISVTVEDSRGFANTAETVRTVCEYMPPVITAFSVQRYSAIYNANEEPDGYAADDLGDHVWVNLAAEVSNIAPADATLNSLAWRIDWVNPITGETRGVLGDGFLKVNLEQDRTVIPEEIPNQETWNYTLTVTDTAGGTAVQYTSVQPGWANFALAASKHGAAFGGLPRGTVENPMLESWYPFYAYGGIHGVNRYEAGEVETGGVWIDGKKIYRSVLGSEVSGNAAENVLLGTIPDVDTIVRMDGMFERTGDSGKYIHPMPYYNSAERYFLPFCNPVTDEVFVQATVSGTAHVIADYTKYEPGELRIVVQPTDIQASGGDTVTFEVIARNAAAYQWQVGGTDGTNWTDLTWTGAKTASMTHTMNATNIKYVYRCKLTGAGGTVLYTNTMRFI